MYTIVYVTKRVPGLTVEQFAEHYRMVHYDLARRIPGLVSYQQSLIDHDSSRWVATSPFDEYDAVSLYTFASHADAVRAFATIEGQATDADTPAFMDWDTILGAPTTVIQRFDSTPHQEGTQA
jgi:uncharacterized protein (TIGR02118 family)